MNVYKVISIVFGLVFLLLGLKPTYDHILNKEQKIEDLKNQKNALIHQIHNHCTKVLSLELKKVSDSDYERGEYRNMSQEKRYKLIGKYSFQRCYDELSDELMDALNADAKRRLEETRRKAGLLNE